ncbi:unnamed protein product [Arabis nemorensis]|uniref:LOB domain-containing protein n=1 Tax=Arabis nemorensis TaxID=586526 RepID=A0A565BUZ0_9BRAS|nr:unnamed protein product [Arabis nemorensis]
MEKKRCAVCRHKRHRCPDDCIFAPHFSGANEWKLQAILSGNLGVAQLERILQEEAVDSLVTGVIDQTRRQVEEIERQLKIVNNNLVLLGSQPFLDNLPATQDLPTDQPSLDFGHSGQQHGMNTFFGGLYHNPCSPFGPWPYSLLQPGLLPLPSSPLTNPWPSSPAMYYGQQLQPALVSPLPSSPLANPSLGVSYAQQPDPIGVNNPSTQEAANHSSSVVQQQQQGSSHICFDQDLLNDIFSKPYCRN